MRGARGQLRAPFHWALRDALEVSQARWILSINDVPEIRELFASYAMEEASLHYGVGGGQTVAKELIIMRL